MLRNDYYSEYTISLQELIESQEINIFDFHYESEFKEELERRFIERYYFREIGYETYSMWHYKFKERWVNRINHYSKLFEQYKDIDPLLDYKEVRTYVENELSKGSENSVGSMSGTGSTTGKDTQRDTPITAYEDSDYVSFVADNSSESESSQSSDVTSVKDNDKNVEVEETKTILNEGQLKRLNEFVDKFKDLQERFINEFVDLFMLIY